MDEFIAVIDNKLFVKLGYLCMIQKGKKPQNLYSEASIGLIPYIDIEAFEKRIFKQYTDGIKCSLCNEDDLLIVWDGSRSGFVGRAYKGAIGSTLAKIEISSYLKDFILYFLKSKYNEMNTRARGVGIPHVDPVLLKNYNLPLISLNEQKRIVNKIEELLSELDHAVESFKKIQQQLKIYRQAVLKAAFEGKLTEQKESYTSPEELLTRIYKERKLTKPLNKLGKDELPKNWINCTISCLGNVGTGATPLKSKISYYENGDISWITSTALNKSFVKEPTAYITKIALKETNVKIFPKHTLLIAMYGEGKTRGKCSELLIEASTNQAIAAITLEGLAEPLRPFLKWFLQKNYNDMRKMSSGGVQPNLNLGIIKNTQIPLPPLEEQNQIVQEIESRLSICDELEKTIEQNLILEKSLRQSILKKAFEGKLVSQDPNDEPAELLLEKIKLEKEKLAKLTNSSKTKTKREKVTA
jgi:type I restriction enzyme S subunit